MDLDLLQSQRLSDLVVLRNNRISASLQWLLTANDYDYTLMYAKGQQLFVRSLRNQEDILASTPLEAAYIWALSCQSAVKRTIQFSDNKFVIACKGLRPGRLFPDTDSHVIRNVTLDSDVVYYADEDRGEGSGKPSHPLADLLFRTADNELVLIDITGSSSPTIVEDKVKKLGNWIAWAMKPQEEEDGKNLSSFQDCTFFGVVLAPNVKSKDVNIAAARKRGVIVVCDEEAIKLLGGLGVVAQYYPFRSISKAFSSLPTKCTYYSN